MKRIVRKVVSTMIVLALIVGSMANGTTKQVQAAVSQVKSTSNYLNSSVEYLYLGKHGVRYNVDQIN